jgi:hypothetical protein
MKVFLIVFGTVILCLAGVSVSLIRHQVVPKETDIRAAPGNAQVEMGPSRKRVDVISRKGKHILTLDIHEDGKNLNIQRGEQNINVQPRR